MKLRLPSQSAEAAENAALREALRTSRASYRSLIESTPEAFVQVDEHGLVVDWNAEAERILGHPRHEAIGSPLERVIPERHRARYREGLEAFRTKGKRKHDVLCRRLEIDLVHHEGHEVPAEVT